MLNDVYLVNCNISYYFTSCLTYLINLSSVFAKIVKLNLINLFNLFGKFVRLKLVINKNYLFNIV